jgi:hypothetical protein
MLTFGGPASTCCDGISRRQLLRVGALGFAGMTLADLLRLESRAETTRRPKSIIYVVLNGGPSHIDMYDLKPDAPAEYRGPFNPIATSLTGVRICELMPLQARMMHQMTLLRGVRSVENDHFLSEVYSGLPRRAGHRPAFGSIVSRQLGSGSSLPAYVSLDRPSSGEFEFERPFYAGPGHGPFRPFGEALADLTPVQSLERLQDRRQLLATFDSARRTIDQAQASGGLDRFHAQALDIITSPRVRDAFDLSREPARVRASYGRGKFPHQTFVSILYDWPSQQFLLARRLVEAGVRVVTLRAGDWDHHSSPNGNIFYCMETMLPALDRSLYALLSDLRERGLEDDVLVVVLGEFGRTPRIAQPGPGREHWADAGCVLFCGGGLRMGQVLGETDARAERARAGNFHFQNIMATIYQTLGIDLNTQLPDFNGRPQYLLDDREPIRELVD